MWFLKGVFDDNFWNELLEFIYVLTVKCFQLFISKTNFLLAIKEMFALS